MKLNLKPITVALVEDMAPMRLITRGLLEHMGVGRIFTAESGQGGLEIVRKNNPDIVITDWMMNPMDGLELTKAIRSDITMPNRFVPIIMVTGFNAMHRVSTARDSGVTEFLIKPFTAQELARRIAYVINKPRDFIETRAYFGPDRRRQNALHFNGQRKRKADEDDTGKVGSPERKP